MNEARADLERVRNLQKIIRLLRDEIRTRRFEIEMPRGVRYDRIRIQAHAEDRLAEQVEALAEKEKELRARLVECEAERKRIVCRVSRLDDPRHVEILIKVYIDNEKIDAAAYAMNYSVDHAKRLHSAALRAYQRKYYGPKT